MRLGFVGGADDQNLRHALGDAARSAVGIAVAGTDDRFGQVEPREHLRTYVEGQPSDPTRKSVERE